MADRFQQFLAGETMKKIRGTFGERLLVPADEYRVQRVSRIRTGIFALDYALGGGFPAGKTNTVWGNKSTGKTVICLRALAGAQRLCANCYTERFNPETGEEKCLCGTFREHVCAYLDVEAAWDQEWARLNGVDTSRLVLSVPESAEQALDIGEALLRSADVDFIVLDSLAFLTPEKEIEESTGKVLPGEQARVVGRGVRKFLSALNHVENQEGRRPTLLFTNQVRMKIGVMYGSPETQPAGLSHGFMATTETKTYGGKYEMDETTGRPLHVDLDFRVEKNRSAGPKVEGSWRLMLANTEVKKKGEIYEEPTMVEKAIAIGLVEKDEKGSGVTCLGERYKTKSLLVKTLMADAKLKRVFSETLMTVLTAG